MTLNAFAAEARRQIFQDLEAGKEPTLGEFSAEALKEARTKGKPQMGSTRYRPEAIDFEFIYPDRGGAAQLLTVEVTSPDRIVFLPVPEWVISQIWQGEVLGSYQFLADALKMIDQVRDDLSPERNAPLFNAED